MLIFRAGIAIILFFQSLVKEPEVIFTEDTPDRMIQISVIRCSGSGDGQYHDDGRDDLWSRRASGKLEWVLYCVNGWVNPRLKVEVDDSRCFDIVYQHDDPERIQVVAQALGLEVLSERRTGEGFILERTDAPLNLKAVAPRDFNPEWVTRRGEQVPLRNASFDQIARYFEFDWRRPVIDQTGLEGHFDWTFSIEDQIDWRQAAAEGEAVPMADSGLSIRWGTTKYEMLVIRDPGP